MPDAIASRPRMVSVDPCTIALDQIDVSQPDLYECNLQGEFFKRLRSEDPVHYCEQSEYGPYWSVTKFNHIIHVQKNHKLFSSEPTVTLTDLVVDMPVPFQAFIQMDPPKHDEHRAAVQGAVAPQNLAKLEPIIRQRAGRILDELPVGDTFDWVHRVSVELTTQMLATLLDFPFESRRKLTYWSDVVSDITGGAEGAFVDAQERDRSMAECLEYFTTLWWERAKDPSGPDLISMLIRSEYTRDLVHKPVEFLGNLLLLIIGGNDTTRNSISGGVYALNQYPEEYQKLRDNPALIPNAVSEIIRWQTPILGHRRNATQDVDLFGKTVHKGDKVMVWYISGNRDEEVFDEADRLIVDRDRARHHISFGFGIHRCMGNRLAEMQLRVVWEEIMKRFHFVEVMGEPKRLRSNSLRGILELPVRLHPL